MDEIEKLKQENEKLKQRIESLEKKNYVSVDMGLSSHVGVIKYDDGTYKVFSKTSSKMFKGVPSVDAAKSAEYEVKTAYIKEALDWIKESNERLEFGGLKFINEINLPVDTVIINPNLRFALELGVINNSQGKYDIERALDRIVSSAKKEAGDRGKQ
jgi:cell division septum initiation protein DivIVA